jgi:hypothetical protein
VPLTALVVRLIERAAEAVATEPVADEAPATAAEPAPPADTDKVGTGPVPREAIDRPHEFTLPNAPVEVDDWHEFGTAVVRDFVANLSPDYTVNPPFDEKRRTAAEKFRPSQAPAPVYPWDRVEKDQIGRTILDLGGGCFRVLDDPSAVYRDIFETFTQYVVECTISFGKRRPRELPWVADVRARYAYLRRREAQKRDPFAF